MVGLIYVLVAFDRDRYLLDGGESQTPERCDTPMNP